jgi:hypothetical protein
MSSHELPIEAQIMSGIDYRIPVGESTLFYPCAGNDLQCPIECFSGVVKNFYFVDIREAGFPRLPERYSVVREHQQCAKNRSVFRCRDKETDNKFFVHRWRERAEVAIRDISSIGIFFFRGDNPVDGEGSSGVLWFGKTLFNEIQSRLANGGLIVTDGSNTTSDGPTEFAKFWHKRDIGASATSKVNAFEYAGREFACIGYVGEMYGPTLVWQMLTTSNKDVRE